MIKNIYLKRIILLLLVVIISFNSIFIRTSEASITLAAAWGGAMVAKEVLALVLLLAMLGITFATHEDAYKMYLDLQNNYNEIFTSIITTFYRAIITDGYDKFTLDIQFLRDFFKDYIYNTSRSYITSGENIINGFGSEYKKVTYNHYIKDGYSVIDIYYNNQLIKTFDASKWGNGTEFTTVKNVKITSVKQLYTSDGIPHALGVEFVFNPVENLEYRVYHYAYKEGYYMDNAEIKINVDETSGILNPEYDAENEDEKKKMVPPPYLGRYKTPYPSISGKLVEQEINGEIEKVYDGNLEELLEDITNDATWEDITYHIEENPSISYEVTNERIIIREGEIDNSLPGEGEGEGEISTGEYSGILGKIQGILEGIGEGINSTTSAITDIFSMPDDLSLDFSPLKLTDFKNKFPFSIPWDLYNSILVFSAEPLEPNIKIDIDTDYLKVFHIIDLSTIQTPLLFSRYVMVIFFIIFLILKTRDLIKW